MSTGRFAQRGWAFQSFAFRTWGLAGADTVEIVRITTKRTICVGTSVTRLDCIGTSTARTAMIGTSTEQREMIGTDP